MNEIMTTEDRFNDFEPYQKVKEQIAKNGLARVYLITTSCGLRSPNSTAAKLEKFASEHQGVHFVQLEHEEWNGSGRSKRVRIPALTAKVNSTEVFAKLWMEAVKIKSRSCGCSVFVSDGQEIEVTVCDPNYAIDTAIGNQTFGDILSTW